MIRTPEQIMELDEPGRISAVADLFRSGAPIIEYGRQIRRLYADDDTFRKFCRLVAAELLVRHGRVEYRNPQSGYSESWSRSAWNWAWTGSTTA